MSPLRATIDGNEAAASVAYRLTEVCAIYPITPSSTMAELADQWSSEGRPNVWGTVPTVVEMQSEGGAAGAVHGAATAGALTTTFTASQGLLLMIPNMFKLAGELTPTVFHVAARAVATHALSIFGDHSDVMCVRSTGFAMLASSSVQEAHDLAAVATAASLEARVPFVHFFDGFRTSHEIAKIELLSDDDLRAMVDRSWVLAARGRGLSPERPVIRGTAQNPDVFFQSREASNRFHAAVPDLVAGAMDRLAALTGRRYQPFDYWGHPRAERVVVAMGSSIETARETVDALVRAGERVGVIQVRLYRPFDAARFLEALPSTARALAVLDRTKEPGSLGEPLYLDVLAALAEGPSEALAPRTVVGGRYGLGSKELTPRMLKAVFDALAAEAPKRHFTVGIEDDVSRLSLDVDPWFSTESARVTAAVFFGLGSDGTVGANKNTIKIIGEGDTEVQGYFVIDSKKSGSMTVSHLRFGPEKIRSAYLIESAAFVACHAFGLLDRVDVLGLAAPGATFLLDAPFAPEEVWDRLPERVRRTILDKELQLWVIDARAVAERAGLGGLTNSVMQTCFFAISGVLPREEALARIRASIAKTYAKKGAAVVEKNFAAVDLTIACLHRVTPAASAAPVRRHLPLVPESAPDFVRRVTGPMMEGRGSDLPVSALPVDGTYPSGTARWEKRNVSPIVARWDADACIQCGNCAFVCPHAAIRAKFYPDARLEGAPSSWRSAPIDARGFPEVRYTLQVYVEDCTGCALCVEACPAPAKDGARAIGMGDKAPILDAERENISFFESLPWSARERVDFSTVRGLQFTEPLFEFSGACAGCGETPYLKVLSQLFGDRMLVANATGCSSIYGGNLPTTPWRANAEGHGPAWSNSLFEDNAEFGLGFRLAADAHVGMANALVSELRVELGPALVDEVLAAPQRLESELRAQRARVSELGVRLAAMRDPRAEALLSVLDHLVRRSVWIVGGDGWAYDIGFGGLDHVLASGADVNVLVLDTEVYSNTGGQQSKATPLGAAARFASHGRSLGKKDLGLQAMTYGHVYVASVALGAKDAQTVKAFVEAERWHGPSLIIARAHCVAHGFELVHGLDEQRDAVAAGVWPLYRFDPAKIPLGESPLHLDAPAPTEDLEAFMMREGRFSVIAREDPARHEMLLARAREEVTRRRALYEQLAAMRFPKGVTAE